MRHAVLVVCLSAAAGCSTADEPSNARSNNLKDQLRQDFRGRLDPGLQTFGSGPSTAIQTDGAGMRIRLAADRKGEDGVGVATRFQVSGDFEITLSYDLLSGPQPKEGFGAGMKLWMSIGMAPKRAVTFAHLRRPQSENAIVALVATWDAAGDKSLEANGFEALATRGRLRLTRTGSTLGFSVAEGDSGEFRELHQATVGTEDVQTMRMMATASNASVPVSIRLRELTIRAERLSIEGSTPAASSTPRWPWAVGAVATAIAIAALVRRRFRR